MVKFRAEILRFGKQGEKTGWTYFVIPAGQAKKIKPGNKKSFRVKGRLDAHPIKGVALLPMGEGDFIMPLNGAMRKAIRKMKGDTLTVQLEEDKSEFVFDRDFLLCLSDDAPALKFFRSLPGAHQRYFSKWIQTAKTDATRTKRIAAAVSALSRSMGYPEMLREQKAKRIA
jgi:hypothetical protein